MRRAVVAIGVAILLSAVAPSVVVAKGKSGTAKQPSTKPTTTLKSTPTSKPPPKTGASSIPATTRSATTVVSDAVRKEAPSIRAVVEKNFAALNDEDLNASMATVDPESDAFAETRRVTQSVFEDFDLKVTLESFELKSVTGNNAVARVVQRTEKLRGPDFKNNRITADWEFRRARGTWYISGQVILDTKPLE